MHDGSYDAVSRTEVPFGVTKFKFNIFIYFFYKNMKDYNGTYGENWTML